ncbi:MAG: hypothetical protein BWK73_04920 [Thiothrix lacustris]|uniref:Uncharacterized protein n=1 Tax=Thiothrix lacustris TaxID=525917 RepID=A0A1Y1QX83_9GAMM|nr:MAG: hypothetical protein BWK73_04920 [Thiothrix lacustris]
MKRLQGIVLSVVCLTATQVQAQEPPAAAPPLAAPNTQTYVPQTQQPVVYPYNSYPSYNYNNYGYSAYPYGYYYPYMQQQQAYSAYNPYYAQPYNPYAAPRMMPAYPQRPPVQQEKKAKPWGDTRYIWPDYYTDFTSEAFDKMINAPYDMGRMPGGVRFPSISMPDPVTVGDAIANQVPPFAEEAGNMVPVDDMGNVLPFK